MFNKICSQVLTEEVPFFHQVPVMLTQAHVQPQQKKATAGSAAFPKFSQGFEISVILFMKKLWHALSPFAAASGLTLKPR